MRDIITRNRNCILLCMEPSTYAIIRYIIDALYIKKYFHDQAREIQNGLYPAVSIL